MGGGTPFFTALDSWVNLNLVETRPFPGGVVLTKLAGHLYRPTTGPRPLLSSRLTDIEASGEKGSWPVT